MSSDECAFKDYEEFFRAYDEFSKEERERKKRDNDYNPLLAIRSESDEVGLHSRFLHSFLNTGGLHYQEDLFLRLFLECLGLNGFFDNAKSVRVQREYKNIDLYLSDGTNHLIIENKIYAGDGDKQISRYIEKIKDKGVEYENIAVVYLNLKGKEEEDLKYSLGEWEIVDKENNQKTLKRANESIYYFKNATYEKEIKEWIKKCQKECKNISNLYMSFEFYKKCVNILIKGEKMGIEKFLEKNKDKRDKFIKIIAEIQRQRAEELSVELFKQKHKKTMEDLNNLSDEKFEEKYEFKKQEYLYKDYVSFEKDYPLKSNKIRERCIICHKNHSEQTFKYVLTLEKTTFNHNNNIGFRLYDEGWKKDGKDEIAKTLKSIIEDKLKEFIKEKSPNIKNIKINQWGWWTANESGEADWVDLSNETLEEYFERLYKKVETLNDFLKDEENDPSSKICELAKELEQNNLTQGGKS